MPQADRPGNRCTTGGSACYAFQTMPEPHLTREAPPTLWHEVHGPWGSVRRNAWREAIKRGLTRLAAAAFRAADTSRGVAVLAYHGTTADRSDPTWLDFAGQMTLLEDLGFRVVPLGAAVAAILEERPPTVPTVSITFDDGWANNVHVAFPELARRGWPASVFVTTSFVGRRPFLSEAELARLADFGVAAEMHTHGHPDLRELDSASIAGEIGRCRDVLERATGVRPGYFCYPFGSFDSRVRDAVAAAGVEAACTGLPGWNPPGSDPLRMRRITLDPGDGPADLRARLAGGDVVLTKARRIFR